MKKRGNEQVDVMNRLQFIDFFIFGTACFRERGALSNLFAQLLHRVIVRLFHVLHE